MTTARESSISPKGYARLDVPAHTPETIAAAALRHGTPRSAEYRAGLLDVLMFKMRGERIQCPYRPGSAQFDAYFAGNDRGFAVYRAYLEQQRGVS